MTPLRFESWLIRWKLIIVLFVFLSLWTETKAYDPSNCWSVITELTEIRSRSELVLTDTPQIGAIAKSIWYGYKEHYSMVVHTYENNPPLVYECGDGLGPNPIKGKGGCGFRILGSSPNEKIEGYHVLN